MRPTGETFRDFRTSLKFWNLGYAFVIPRTFPKYACNCSASCKRTLRSASATAYARERCPDEDGPKPTFVYYYWRKMLRSRSLRWRSIAIKTTIFVVVIIALRVAFTTNAVSSSLPLLSRPAVVKSYPSAPADIELRPGAISMMIVGDSLTQGSEGDWTWRYRLWEWLKSQEVLVDFVGPFLGTRPTTASLDELIVPEPLGLPPTGTATDTTGVREVPKYFYNCFEEEVREQSCSSFLDNSNIP